jgi:cyclic pyranopterin phosphate synthase
MNPIDRLGRLLRSLRISVTDRCNLRCQYCMPEEEYVWLRRDQLLSFEEIGQVAGVFAGLGVEKFRLTGGEPLVRRDLPELIKLLARDLRIRDLALTTNGILLAEQASALKQAGLHRVTVSLDTLRPERFRDLAKRDALGQVLAGIDAALSAGFRALKLDSVVIRGVNDDELIDLLEFGRNLDAEVRFIEYMDVGGATQWTRQRVFSRVAMLSCLEAHYGSIRTLQERGSDPAERFELPNGYRFGIIASTTTPFCGACDRSRLTADGMWFLCLYAKAGLDLRRLLRRGALEPELESAIREAWGTRADKGAEERLALEERGPLVTAAALRQDPHLEMHTRGG